MGRSVFSVQLYIYFSGVLNFSTFGCAYIVYRQDIRLTKISQINCLMLHIIIKSSFLIDFSTVKKWL